MENTTEETIIAYNLYRIDATDEVKDKFLCNYLDKNKKGYRSSYEYPEYVTQFIQSREKPFSETVMKHILKKHKTILWAFGKKYTSKISKKDALSMLKSLQFDLNDTNKNSKLEFVKALIEILDPSDLIKLTKNLDSNITYAICLYSKSTRVHGHILNKCGPKHWIQLLENKNLFSTTAKDICKKFINECENVSNTIKFLEFIEHIESKLFYYEVTSYIVDVLYSHLVNTDLDYAWGCENEEYEDVIEASMSYEEYSEKYNKYLHNHNLSNALLTSNTLSLDKFIKLNEKFPLKDHLNSDNCESDLFTHFTDEEINSLPNLSKILKQPRKTNHERSSKRHYSSK